MATLSEEEEKYRRRNIERREQSKREEASPFGRSRWVRLQNLQATDLNGKMAEVIRKPNVEDRFAVRIKGDNGKFKLIKRKNLDPFPDSETVKVCRLSCSGENGGMLGQTLRWPIELLESENSPYCESPISSLLGFPLRITRVKSRDKLKTQDDFDNQWATWMMIDPATGIAPPEWQSNVGPVVVWRERGHDVSFDDMTLLSRYISDLLDQYSDEEGVQPDRDITPSVWAKRKSRVLENRRFEIDTYAQMDSFVDINI